jgi:hypothetical protein
MGDDIVVAVTWSSEECDVVRMAPGEVLQVVGRVKGAQVSEEVAGEQ